MNKDNFSLIKIQSLLVYLLPISIVLSIFVADLIVVIVSLIFVFQSFKQDNTKYFFNKFVLLFFLWNIILIIESLLSYNILLSLESSLLHFRFIVFSIAIWFIIDNNRKFINTFTTFFIITFCVVILDAYIQYITGYNTFNYPYNGYRLAGFFDDKLVLGNYLSRLLPLFFALMIVSFMNSKKNILFSLTILIAVDIIIVLSGERTAIILSLIGTIGIIILINKYKLIRLIALVIAMLLSFIIIYNDANVKERVITSTINELDLFEENKHFFSEGHELYYQTSYYMFLDHKIFGIGPKNYRILCNDPRYFKLIQTKDNLNNTCSTHPHNTYAQLIAETGIMGTLPVIFLFFFIFSLLLRHFVSMISMSDKNRLTDYQICLLVSVFLSLWPLVPTLNFFNNWISIIYFLPVGFLLQAFDKSTNN